MSKSIFDIREITKRLSTGDVTCVDIAKEALSKIAKMNDSLNAFVEVDEKYVLEQAYNLHINFQSDIDNGPLYGVPIAVKNNIDIKGYKVNACSEPLKNRLSPADAACIRELKKAGALIIGTTNMHELAYGGTGHLSVYDPSRNPNDIKRIPGGSSSGSAVAVASGMVPLALGTDTGGSVRIPASACGVVGFKPSINAIDTQGVLPLSWTLDHVGTIASCVSDAAIGAGILMGDNSRVGRDIINSSKGLNTIPDVQFGNSKICLIEFDDMPLSPSVSKFLYESIKLISSGVSVVETKPLEYSVESHVAWLNIMYPEAASFYTEDHSIDYTKFSSATRVQLEAGRHVSALDYLKAQRFRANFSHYFNSFFDEYDFVIMPTLPVVAPLFDEENVSLGGKEVSVQDAMTFTNSIANMLGCPAITIPLGVDDSYMPIGLTILSPFKDDVALINVAKMMEKLISFQKNN